MCSLFYIHLIFQNQYNKVIKYTLTVIYLLSCCLLNAQTNYQKGIIVTGNKDTIQAFIDYKEWERNPSSFKYITDANSREVKIGSPREIIYLEITGKEYFEAHKVSISQNKVAPIEQLSRSVDTIKKTDFVFLRLLQKGNRVNLYSLTDNIKNRFYIKETDKDTVVELVYNRYLSPGYEAKLITDERYKNQLVQVSNKYKDINTAELIKVLNKAAYHSGSLLEILGYINSSAISLLPESKDKAGFYIGIGMAASKAAYNGKNELASGATSKLSIWPTLSAGLNLYINPHVRKTVIRFDFSFVPARQKITKSMGIDNGHVTHTFDKYSFVLSPQVILNLYNNQHFKFNVGVGLSGIYSIYGNSLYEMNYTEHNGIGGKFNYKNKIDLEAFGLSLPLRAGFLLKQKIDLYAQYNIPVTPITAYDFYAIRVKSAQLGINFIF